MNADRLKAIEQRIAEAAQLSAEAGRVRAQPDPVHPREAAEIEPRVRELVKKSVADMLKDRDVASKFTPATIEHKLNGVLAEILGGADPARTVAALAAELENFDTVQVTYVRLDGVVVGGDLTLGSWEFVDLTPTSSTKKRPANASIFRQTGRKQPNTTPNIDFSSCPK
jgi:hypothetical protein